ncbi:MAG TPA: CPBP family intramembrane glutamic endopeptidase [Acidobacteriaceae bacterium]|jgi:hypothetical protein
MDPENLTHPATPVPGEEQTTLAPWWHTAAIVIVVGAMATLAHFSQHAAASGAHVPVYLSQMMMIWLIVGSVVAGIYQRRLFFFRTLQRNRAPWWAELLRGAGIYFFIVMAFGVVMVIVSSALAVRQLHQERAAGQSKATVSQGELQQDVEAKLHLDRKVVRAFAPQTGWQLLLWFGVSLTAGFCEEHIFRGYLLNQGIAWMARLDVPRWIGLAVPIAASSLLFGSLHVYEGIGGAVLIGFLGATYCVAALYFKNLRAVIVAHTLQDFLAGLALFLKHT